MRKLLFMSVAGLAIVVGVTACSSGGGGTSSGSSSSKPASSPAFNAADVRFAQQMIPHHAQAIEMAKLASTRASSPAVKQLASRIEAAQQPEIDQMTGWLRTWKQKVPSTGGMDMGSGSDMGMMTTTEMSDLTAASGTKFDTMFLTMMTAHHKGAVVMAKSELATGQSPQAKALAQAIINAQEAEIAEMQRLLAAP